MNHVRRLTVSALALLTACADLPHEPVQPVWYYDCPKQTAAAVIAEQNRLGPSSDTKILACALDVLGNTQDSLVRRTALGSRLSLLLAERESDPDNREKLAARGVEFAETALNHGGGSDGAVHYYLAANLGLAVREHITEAMANLGRLEDEMQKAVALSPDIDQGGPLRLLGALYLKAPPWPSGIGDADKALALLEEAVRKHPGHPMNHLFYAQALWDEYDDTTLSRVKAELALGRRLLAEGDWGYSKVYWNKEFAEFEQALADAE